MRLSLATAAMLLSAVISGCALKPQQPIPLSQEAVDGNNRIGVAMSALPKADTHFPGADCLLCYAFASASNSSLTKHTETLTRDELAALQEEVAAALRKKSADAVTIKEPIDLKSLSDIRTEEPTAARKDFKPMRSKLAVDKLLVIDVQRLGYVRTYASYVPTSDPKATVVGAAYLVDLKTNTYNWYVPVNVSLSAGPKWDEPPKFPSLTNAYFQALEASRDTILKPLTEDAPTRSEPVATVGK